MAKKGKLNHYFDPGNTETNDSLYLTLTAKGLPMEKVILYYQGKPIEVFPVDDKFVNYIRNADISFPYDAKIYAEDSSGVVMLWKLHKRPVIKKARAHLRRSKSIKRLTAA